jgi:hypothetical protein
MYRLKLSLPGSTGTMIDFDGQSIFIAGVFAYEEPFNVVWPGARGYHLSNGL